MILHELGSIASVGRICWVEGDVLLESSFVGVVDRTVGDPLCVFSLVDCIGGIM